MQLGGMLEIVYIDRRIGIFRILSILVSVLNYPDSTSSTIQVKSEDWSEVYKATWSDGYHYNSHVALKVFCPFLDILEHFKHIRKEYVLLQKFKTLDLKIFTPNLSSDIIDIVITLVVSIGVSEAKS